MAVAHRGLGAVPEPAGARPAVPPGDGRPRSRARHGVAAGPRGVGPGPERRPTGPGDPSAVDRLGAAATRSTWARCWSRGRTSRRRSRPTSPSMARPCGPTWWSWSRAASKARLLIQTYPLRQKLSRVVEGKPWAASPDTRMMQLLHDTGVRLGLVTNGDQWMLVDAPKGETTGYASWYRPALAGGAEDAPGVPHPAGRPPVLRRARGGDARTAAGPERPGPAGSHRPAWLSGAAGGRGARPLARQGDRDERRARC